MIDPFTDLAAWAQRTKDHLVNRCAEIDRSVKKIALSILIPVGLGAILGAMAWGELAAKTIAFLGVGITLAVLFPKWKKSAELNRDRLKYFPD